MIKITEEEVVGYSHAIRGMRNPMNSWDKSDSYCLHDAFEYDEFVMGERDHDLAMKLSYAGTDHGKFLRFIQVYCDINAPLYWWKEFDTYRMGVEKNSCSTMHKIHSRELTIDDFSVEGLTNDNFDWFYEQIIEKLNLVRQWYIDTKDPKWWFHMIQILPSSYNQKRTVMMSYAALRNMYHARKNHKLEEWHDFCKWIENLPYSELITGVIDES